MSVSQKQVIYVLRQFVSGMNNNAFDCDVHLLRVFFSSKPLFPINIHINIAYV